MGSGDAGTEAGRTAGQQVVGRTREIRFVGGVSALLAVVLAEPLVEEGDHAAIDLVADRADLLGRALARVVEVPVVGVDASSSSVEQPVVATKSAGIVPLVTISTAPPRPRRSHPIRRLPPARPSCRWASSSWTRGRRPAVVRPQ